MAITHDGNIGSQSSKTSSNTVVITTTAVAEVGKFVVVWTAWDNNNGVTTTGPDDPQLTCTDSAGNTYERLAGAQNASGGANTKSHATIFIGRITTELASGGTITVTQTASNRTAKASSAHKFTADFDLRRTNRSHLHTAAADPGAISLTLPTTPTETLMLHCLAAEAPIEDAYTWDVDYTQITAAGTTGGTADTNMSVLGGFRIAELDTTDTVDVTSDTADRDYTQLLVSLLEVAPSESQVELVDTAKNSAVNANVTVTHGFTFQDDDYVFAFCFCSLDVQMDLLSGWTNVVNFDDGLGNDRGVRVQYRRVTDASGEASSYTFTGGGGNARTVILLQLRNVNTTTPIDTTVPTSSQLDNPNADALDVLINTSGSLFLTFEGISSNASISFTPGAPSGLAIADSITQNVAAGFHAAQNVAYKEDELLGVTSYGNWTNSGLSGTDDVLLVSFAVRPAPAPPPITFVPQIIRYYT